MVTLEQATHYKLQGILALLQAQKLQPQLNQLQQQLMQLQAENNQLKIQLKQGAESNIMNYQSKFFVVPAASAPPLEENIGANKPDRWMAKK